MKCVHTVRCLSILIMTLFGFISCSDKKETDFLMIADLDDKQSDKLLIGSYKLSSDIVCASLCLSNSNCESYFYNDNLMQCRLHSGVFEIGDVLEADESGWSFYKSDGEYYTQTDAFLKNNCYNFCLILNNVNTTRICVSRTVRIQCCSLGNYEWLLIFEKTILLIY